MSFLNKIGNYFVNSFEEIKKVSWPSKKEALRLSLIVIISVIIAMLVLAGIDWALTKIVNIIIGG